MNKLFLRNEINNLEFRTPLIPTDTKKLIDNGFTIIVQSSENRIFTDAEYLMNGCVIVYDDWYNYKNTLIIGLKQFNNIEKLDSHIHTYFSHSFKKQNNSDIILKSFFNSNSILYDLEYFLNNNNNRLVSFGYYAGISGAAIALLQFYNKQKNINFKLSNLKYYESEKILFTQINNIIDSNIKPLIGIIGYNGKSGKGVCTILDKFNLNYDTFSSDSYKNNLEKYDILFNCILLKDNTNETWFDNTTIFNKNILIVDISCDYNSPNNPIKIYNHKTTFENPIYNYNNYVDIIAIDNLPSLLPFESSTFFSHNLIDIIIDYPTDINKFWKNNYNLFLEKCI